MFQAKYLVDRIYKHVEENGTEGLLPQNLTGPLLNRMILEVDAISKDETDETPSVVLLMSIMLLQDNASISNLMQIRIGQKELMDCFDLYIRAIKYEYEVRDETEGDHNKHRPTLENIFKPDTKEPKID